MHDGPDWFEIYFLTTIIILKRGEGFRTAISYTISNRNVEKKINTFNCTLISHCDKDASVLLRERCFRAQYKRAYLLTYFGAEVV